MMIFKKITLGLVAVLSTCALADFKYQDIVTKNNTAANRAVCVNEEGKDGFSEAVLRPCGSLNGLLVVDGTNLWAPLGFDLRRFNLQKREVRKTRIVTNE